MYIGEYLLLLRKPFFPHRHWEKFPLLLSLCAFVLTSCATLEGSASPCSIKRDYYWKHDTYSGHVCRGWHSGRRKLLLMVWIISPLGFSSESLMMLLTMNVVWIMIVVHVRMGRWMRTSKVLSTWVPCTIAIGYVWTLLHENLLRIKSKNVGYPLTALPGLSVVLIDSFLTRETLEWWRQTLVLCSKGGVLLLLLLPIVFATGVDIWRLKSTWSCWFFLIPRCLYPLEFLNNSILHSRKCRYMLLLVSVDVPILHILILKLV